MNKKIIIESLAMDLKRIALGLNRGSYKMADRFKDEALKRENELIGEKDEYLRKLLSGTRKVLSEMNDKAADDILMYSTLFQNFVAKRIKEEADNENFPSLR